MPLFKHSISGLSVGEACGHVTIYSTSTGLYHVFSCSTVLKESQSAFVPIFLYILNTTSSAKGTGNLTLRLCASQKGLWLGTQNGIELEVSYDLGQPPIIVQ